MRLNGVLCLSSKIINMISRATILVLFATTSIAAAAAEQLHLASRTASANTALLAPASGTTIAGHGFQIIAAAIGTDQEDELVIPCSDEYRCRSTS